MSGTDREAEVARIAADFVKHVHVNMRTATVGELAAALYDAGLRASPAPTAPLDVALDVRGFAPPGIDDPLRDFMATYFDREDDYTRGMVIDYLDRIAARHATPDQRHMGSGSLDERANG